jgi:tetratricopeptide (TPR) repeat protein
MSSTATGSTSKLHPVYVALDSHQYQRAIKLCLALPPDHLLGQALLIHSYAKAQQRHLALHTLHRLLLHLLSTGSSASESPSVTLSQCFPELHLEWEASHRRTAATTASSTTTSGTPSVGSSSTPIVVPKGGKKGGKKKPASVPSATTIATTTNHDAILPPLSHEWDWIDALDHPPQFLGYSNTNSTSHEGNHAASSKELDSLPPLPTVHPPGLPDATLLATLQTTLLHALKLPLTAFSLYAWAAAAPSSLQALFTKQALLTGMAVYVTLPYANEAALSRAWIHRWQALALQLARVQPRAAAWAAHMTIWWYQGAIASDDSRQRAVLPRLAESLALKAWHTYETPTTSTALTTTTANNSNNWMENGDDNKSQGTAHTECFLLYMRTLQIQDKWSDVLQIVTRRWEQGQHTNPNIQTLQELQLHALEHLERYEEALQVLEQQLLPTHPDQWTYWKQHIQLNLAAHAQDVSCLSRTEELAASLGSQQPSTSSSDLPSPKVMRGPLLVPLQVQLEIMRHFTDNEISESSYTSFLDEWMTCLDRYTQAFARKYQCAFDDVRPYVTELLAFDKHRCNEFSLSSSSSENDSEPASAALRLLQWLQKPEFQQLDNQQQQHPREGWELRYYLFSIQMTYQILVEYPEYETTYMPSWHDMVACWSYLQTKDQVDQVRYPKI